MTRREDHSDRRAKSLELTANGRETAAQVEAVSREVRSHVLGDLSDDELKLAFRVLAAVRDRLLAMSQAEAA